MRGDPVRIAKRKYQSRVNDSRIGARAMSVHVEKQLFEERRGLTSRETARFYGLSSSAFYKARRNGLIPAPTLPGGRYDRVLLEKEMNRLSGITDPGPQSLLDTWRSGRGQNQP